MGLKKFRSNEANSKLNMKDKLSRRTENPFPTRFVKQKSPNKTHDQNVVYSQSLHIFFIPSFIMFSFRILHNIIPSPVTNYGSFGKRYTDVMLKTQNRQSKEVQYLLLKIFSAFDDRHGAT